jgi:hypothetical protein
MAKTAPMRRKLQSTRERVFINGAMRRGVHSVMGIDFYQDI